MVLSMCECMGWIGRGDLYLSSGRKNVILWTMYERSTGERGRKIFDANKKQLDRMNITPILTHNF